MHFSYNQFKFDIIDFQLIFVFNYLLLTELNILIYLHFGQAFLHEYWICIFINIKSFLFFADCFDRLIYLFHMKHIVDNLFKMWKSKKFYLDLLWIICLKCAKAFKKNKGQLFIVDLAWWWYYSPDLLHPFFLLSNKKFILSIKKWFF